MNHHQITSPQASKRRVLSLLLVILTVGGGWGIIAVTKPFFSKDNPAKSAEQISLESHGEYQPPSEAGYAGSAACTDCHSEIAESYAAHPMAVSTLTIAENEWLKNECRFASVPGQNRLLSVSCENDRLVHHERMFDDVGELIYDQDYPMDYVVGSGQRAKAYIRREGDLMFMSPLNWYRQSENWDLAPNYRPDDVRRFRRRVTDACLSCHSGRLRIAQRNSNQYPPPVFHEMQIGCERCHGPGRDHIEFHERAEPLAGETDPIINPAKLDHARRESVCYQCHLSSAARVLRPGRSHLDFRPGMTLSDIWAILDAGTQVTQVGRTRSVNHVQQMRDSRCYTESAGIMGCVTCHDPHQVPAANSRIAYYRKKCLNCHEASGCSLPLQERQLKRNDCVTCHMPSLESSNMSHVAQTDHRILRTPLEPDRDISPASSANLRFFAEMDEDLPPPERLRAMAAGTFVYCTEKGISFPADLQQDLERALQHFPDDYLLLTILGNLAWLKNDLTAARFYLEQACQVSEVHEDALDKLLEIYYQTADWGQAVRCAEKLVRIDPTDAGVHAMLGDALINLGRMEEGMRSVERAAELNPGALPLHEWLFVQYSRQGLTELAEEKRKMVEKLRSARIPERLMRPNSGK